MSLWSAWQPLLPGQMDQACSGRSRWMPQQCPRWWFYGVQYFYNCWLNDVEICWNGEWCWLQANILEIFLDRIYCWIYFWIVWSFYPLAFGNCKAEVNWPWTARMPRMRCEPLGWCQVVNVGKVVAEGTHNRTSIVLDYRFINRYIIPSTT